MFMQVLDQFRVSWQPPDVGEGQSARPLTAGSLVVTKDMSVPNDVTRLVSTLLENGYEKITVEKIHHWSN